MGRPPSQPRAPAACARSPEADVARVQGSRSAPRPARRPPSRLARCSSRCFQTCCASIWGTRGRPGRPGARAAGDRARGRRECARAARGAGPGVGSLPPPILEKGACPRRAPARGRRRRFAALGITPPSPGPQAGGDAAKLRSPSSTAGSGPSRASVGASVKWGRGLCSRSPSGSVPPRSSRDPACRARSVLGLRRPGQPAPEAAKRPRTHAAGPGRRRPGRAGRAAGARVASAGALAPWSARPAGPRLPERVLEPRARPLGTPPVRGPGDARGCGGGGRRAARCLGRPGEGARARPPPCPPLTSPPRPAAPAHPGQPRPPPPAPGSLRSPARAPGWTLSPSPRHRFSANSPGPRAPVPPCPAQA